MINIKKLFKKNIYILGALFVFLLFSFISVRTPLAGDDWGYAINGRMDNPILMAINFYYSWSGRFFSELYGFVVCNNKELWNILNPLLFTGIFVLLFLLSKKEKNNYLNIILIIFLMLSVENDVRMETYTWLMGTTYIIPLFLSLVYVYLAFKQIESTKHNILITVINCVVLLVSCLMMENISIAMVVATTMLSIYVFFNKKELTKYFVVNMIVAIAAFTIMRLSPGASYRLLRDNAEWSKLSIIGKMLIGYPSFIKMTFTEHRYMVLMLSLSMTGLIIKNFKRKRLLNALVILLFALSIPLVFTTLKFNVIIQNIYWPIYVVITYLVIYLYICNKDYRNKILFLLTIGGVAGLSMIMSPLYGYRSSIYTLYYVFVVTLLIFNDYLENKYIKMFMAAFLMLLTINKTRFYINTYREVARINDIRISEISYYKDNPDVEEAWIQRYPLKTIHGADIDPGDSYHFEVFKEYHELPQDTDKIYFYISE